MVVPESGVMTRSRSKASTAVAKTVAKKKKKKTRPIVHAWNWKTDITKTRKVICGKKKPPKAFYKSKLFINNVKSDALDIFLEENEALNEFVRIHKDDDPKTTAPTKRRLIMDRYKDWCTMTLLEQAPYLKRAAKNYLEEDKTMEKMLRKVR